VRTAVLVAFVAGALAGGPDLGECPVTTLRASVP